MSLMDSLQAPCDTQLLIILQVYQYTYPSN